MSENEYKDFMLMEKEIAELKEKLARKAKQVCSLENQAIELKGKLKIAEEALEEIVDANGCWHCSEYETCLPGTESCPTDLAKEALKKIRGEDDPKAG